MKKVVTVQDLSCFGKCSLTLALPVLSALGVSTTILPTAILSTHTGGLGKPASRSLSQMAGDVVHHWSTLDLAFDAVYTGYLGSGEDVQIVSALLEHCGKNALLYVDPAMADNGRLYTGFTPDYVRSMAELCKKADIVMPNCTEAAMLLGETYHEGIITRAYAASLLKGLQKLGANAALLTGISFEAGQIGSAFLGANGSLCEVMTDKIEGSYHGTGDLFASVVVGSLVKGKGLLKSAQLAAAFVSKAIEKTIEEGGDKRHGLCFEYALELLMAER